MPKVVDNVDLFKERRVALAHVFTPRAPVREAELFAGTARNLEVEKLMYTMLETGAVVLHGERGVGKTSLVQLAERLLKKYRPVVSVVASQGISFARLWQIALNDVTLSSPRRTAGFDGGDGSVSLDRLGARLRDDAEPADVVSLLKHLTGRVVFVFDEFDRLLAPETTVRFADLIKAVTDLGLPVMLVIVGVGDDLSDLFAAHESVERSLRTVHLRRMDTQEIADLLHRGCKQLEMSMTGDAVARIVGLSRGLPHYAHLLGFHGAAAALKDETLSITLAHVERASFLALDAVEASVRDHYKRAVASGRADATYAQVLAACALAKMDEQGYFRPVDVCGPMHFILGREVPLAAFSPKLLAFTKAQRGAVLSVNRKGGRPKYRFTDPLLQPYALLCAIQNGIVLTNVLSAS